MQLGFSFTALSLRTGLGSGVVSPPVVIPVAAFMAIVLEDI